MRSAVASIAVAVLAAANTQALERARPSAFARPALRSVRMMSTGTSSERPGLFKTFVSKPAQAPFHALSLALLQRDRMVPTGSILGTPPAQVPFHALSLALLQRAAVAGTLQRTADAVIQTSFHAYSVMLLQLQRVSIKPIESCFHAYSLMLLALQRVKPIESCFYSYSLALLRLQATQQESSRMRQNFRDGLDKIEDATATLMRDEKDEKYA